MADSNQHAPLLLVEGDRVALGPLRRDLVPTYQRWVSAYRLPETSPHPPQNLPTAGQHHNTSTRSRTSRRDRVGSGQMRPRIGSWFRPADLLDRTFEVGIVLKGIDGALEVLGGLLLLLVSPATINRITTTVTQHELSEDPHDFIATHLLKTAHGLTGSAVHFGASYLLSHGLVKVVLVVALLRNKLWAYPWMIAFLGVFIGYQAYRLTFRPSVGLAALTVFDIFVVWLTVREYRRQLAGHRPATD